MMRPLLPAGSSATPARWLFKGASTSAGPRGARTSNRRSEASEQAASSRCGSASPRCSEVTQGPTAVAAGLLAAVLLPPASVLREGPILSCEALVGQVVPEMRETHQDWNCCMQR